MNKDKVRNRLKQANVVPVVLTTGDGLGVDLTFYFVTRTGVSRLAYVPDMDDKIAQYLSRLLKLINARTFDPVLFLQDFLQRRMRATRRPVPAQTNAPIKRTGGAPNETWFGLSSAQQQAMGKRVKIRQFVMKVLALDKSSKHGVVVQGNYVFIYNSSLCAPQSIIMVPVKYLSKRMGSMLPSKLRKVLKEHCHPITSIIKRFFPDSIVQQVKIKRSKEGDTMTLYTDNPKTRARVPVENVFRTFGQTNAKFDDFFTNPRASTKKYTYETLRTLEEKTLEDILSATMKTEKNVSKGLGATRGKKYLLALVISAFHNGGNLIADWADVLQAAKRKFFSDVAGDIGYTFDSGSITLGDKRIILFMMQGMSEDDAIKRVRSGIQGEYFVTYNRQTKRTTKRRLDRVQQMASILGTNNLHAVAARIGNKDDFYTKWYKEKEHQGIPSNAFVKLYRRHSPNNNTFMNQRTSKLAVNEYINERRRDVDRKLILGYGGNKNRIEFASYMLAEAYKIAGNLEDRPLFTGLVGNPMDSRCPEEQYRVSLQNAKEDGCRKATPWETGDYSLSVHQSVAFAIINLRAMGHLLDVPGLFCYYSVGAGKTVIVLSSIVAYWNTDKSIIPASVRSNSRGNDLKKMGEEASLYFRSFRCTLGVRTVNNKQYPFLEYPFVDAETAEDQLRMRLKFGHAMAGHPGAHALADTHLLNSYATALTVLRNSTGKTRAVKGRRVTQHTPVPRIENTVFVLDEIQLLFNPPTSEAHLRKEYARFQEILVQRDPKSCFTIALTATPGDTPQEVYNVYSMVVAKAVTRIPQRVTLSAYVTGDTRYFPEVIVKNQCIPLPESQFRGTGVESFSPADVYLYFYLKHLAKRETVMHATHKLAAQAFASMYGSMPSVQYKKTMKTYINQTHHAKLVEQGKLKERYYRRAKDATEFLQITESVLGQAQKPDEDAMANDNNSIEETGDVMKVLVAQATKQFAHHMVISQTATTDKNRVGKKTVTLLSPKIIEMIKVIRKLSGVHFVYVENKTTMRLIGHILKTVYDWGQYKDENSAPGRDNGGPNGGRKSIFGFINAIEGSKLATRYYDSTKGTMIAPLGASVADANSLMRLIQKDTNLSGDKCKVIFASGDSFKGVNTKAVRHLHVVSPMAKWGDLLQLVGRATRFKSHCGLPKDKRNVTLYRWSLQPPPKQRKLYPLFPDDYVLAHSYDHFKKGVGQLNKQIVQSSIQTLLNDTTKKQQDLERQLASVCDHQLTINMMVAHAKKMEQAAARDAQKAAVKEAEEAKKLAAVTKSVVKEAVASKKAAKKTPAKKTPAKKTPATKKTPAKKTPAKKTPATRPPPTRTGSRTRTQRR